MSTNCTAAESLFGSTYSELAVGIPEIRPMMGGDKDTGNYLYYHPLEGRWYCGELLFDTGWACQIATKWVRDWHVFKKTGCDLSTEGPLAGVRLLEDLSAWQSQEDAKSHPSCSIAKMYHRVIRKGARIEHRNVFDMARVLHSVNPSKAPSVRVFSESFPLSYDSRFDIWTIFNTRIPAHAAECLASSQACSWMAERHTQWTPEDVAAFESGSGIRKLKAIDGMLDREKAAAK